MGNFKLSKGVLESPRCNYSTKKSYQGKAPITGMSDEEAKSIDEHDNAIPKETKKIPTISANNNFTQTPTGGKRHKASAGKKTPVKLPKTKEEQPKTQDVNNKEEDNKPKPSKIKKDNTNK